MSRLEWALLCALAYFDADRNLCVTRQDAGTHGQN
jgi:hypothetical protein